MGVTEDLARALEDQGWSITADGSDDGMNDLRRALEKVGLIEAAKPKTFRVVVKRVVETAVMVEATDEAHACSEAEHVVKREHTDGHSVTALFAEEVVIV